jgi:hypothetical protein
VDGSRDFESVNVWQDLHRSGVRAIASGRVTDSGRKRADPDGQVEGNGVDNNEIRFDEEDRHGDGG